MNSFSNNLIQKVSDLFPTLGISIYFVLFFYSASIYPGGSQADLKSTGYSLQNNYWCELMNHEAMNGQANPAAPYATLGIIFLGLAIGCFFYRLPLYCNTSGLPSAIVRVGSILASTCAVFLFSDFHNPLLIGFSIFTFITVALSLVMLYSCKLKWQFWSGLFGFAAIQLNNFMYYARFNIAHLPWIQKLTIVYVLLWIVSINLQFYSLSSHDQNHKKI